MVLISFIMCIGFSSIHLVSRFLKFLNVTPRSRFLSFAGGVAVSYAFVWLLPELEENQLTIEESRWRFLEYFDHHIYLVALLGLIVFYGLERYVKKQQSIQKQQHRPRKEMIRLFYLHISFFAIYNLVTGYLLYSREETSMVSLVMYFIAIGIHFFVNDHALRETHKDLYDSLGRYILAVSILAGWVLGALTVIHVSILAIVNAFLAGSIIMNIMKEELPEERESRFSAFLLGALCYTVIILTI